MSEIKDFPCTGCGICCEKVGATIEWAKSIPKKNRSLAQQYIVSFPYKVDENGACENLAEDRSCKVYDHRPQICRIREQYPVFKTPNETLAEFYHKNAVVCNSYMKEAGYPDEELIDLTKLREA